MEFVTTSSGRLAYDLAGRSGDPTVLVHGGWDDRRTWDRVVPGLSVSLELLVYDRRGHGASPGPARVRPVREDAGDLAALLEATGQFPAHLVAHAYGGAVALRLAIDRPELVRSVAVHEIPYLALLGAGVGDGPASSPSAALSRLRALARAVPASAAEGYLEAFAAPDERWPTLDHRSREDLVANAGAWADEMGDPESIGPNLSELRGLAVPVLATSGASSPTFAARIHDRLVAELPNGHALRLVDGGHRIHRTNPDLWVGVLGTFLLERNVPTT